MNIQILHVLWPRRVLSRRAAFSDIFRLKKTMFVGPEVGPHAQLQPGVLDKLAARVEALRARALAARHRFLVDAFCDAAKDRPLAVAVQPSRHILLKGAKGRIVVVPMVGVPSALRLHDIYREIGSASTGKPKIWALYDERGLLREMIAHLDWLNVSLPIQAVSVFESSARLDAERRP